MQKQLKSIDLPINFGKGKRSVSVDFTGDVLVDFHGLQLHRLRDKARCRSIGFRTWIRINRRCSGDFFVLIFLGVWVLVGLTLNQITAFLVLS